MHVLLFFKYFRRAVNQANFNIQMARILMNYNKWRQEIRRDPMLKFTVFPIASLFGFFFFFMLYMMAHKYYIKIKKKQFKKEFEEKARLKGLKTSVSVT